MEPRLLISERSNLMTMESFSFDYFFVDFSINQTKKQPD
jgi:hypothetical protein